MNRRIVSDLASAPAFVLVVFAACSHPQPPQRTVEQKSAAADAAYSADLMSCVDPGKYPTRIESDFCVTTTKKRWGRP